MLGRGQPGSRKADCVWEGDIIRPRAGGRRAERIGQPRARRDEIDSDPYTGGSSRGQPLQVPPPFGATQVHTGEKLAQRASVGPELAYILALGEANGGGLIGLEARPQTSHALSANAPAHTEPTLHGRRGGGASQAAHFRKSAGRAGGVGRDERERRGKNLIAFLKYLRANNWRTPRT